MNIPRATPPHIDLLVAGGGPAGLATALYAAKAGLEVVVIEKRCGPIDKACGEGLMPHSIGQLNRLGVDPPGQVFRGISYIDSDHRVTATFRSGPGRGVRRTALHTALFDAATAAGVKVIQGDVDQVTQDDVAVTCNGLRARYLAAADGLHSPIRSSLGLDMPSKGRRRWGIRRHVQIPPWSDNVEVHWSPDKEAYITPVAEDRIGIAILTSEKGGFAQHLSAFPELVERVREHDHGPDRAAGPLRQRVRNRTAGRVMLVGDAAGYVDALTGEGLGIAFGAAELLVGCVVAERPQDYDRQWRRMSRRYRLLTAATLRATEMPAIRTRIVPTAARLPRVFSVMVNQLAT